MERSEDGCVAGGRPAQPMPTAAQWLDPRAIRFSQSTISGQTYYNGRRISLRQLVDSFETAGYVAEPISVVRMPDGGLTSLDNRRLWAARTAGLDSMSALIHDPGEPFISQRQAAFLRRDTPVIDHAGEMGMVGAVVYHAFHTPDTHLAAIILRCSRQVTPAGTRDFPLMGSYDLPRCTGQELTKPAQTSHVTAPKAKSVDPAAEQRYLGQRSQNQPGSVNSSKQHLARPRRPSRKTNRNGGIER